MVPQDESQPQEAFSAPAIGVTRTEPIRGNVGDRRRTDEIENLAEANLSMGKLPVWARVVAMVGLPGACLLYLLWFVTRGTPIDAAARTTMETNTQILQQHIQSSSALGETLKQLEIDHHESNRRIENFLFIMCVQQAKTDAGRQACAGVK